MPDQLSELRFSRYYRQFSNPLAFSNRTLFLVSLPLIATNLTLDYGREPGTFFEWFIVSFIGYAALLLGALLIRPIFSKWQVPLPLYLPTYWLLGLLRGTAIYLVGTSVGVVDLQEVAYRLLGSGTYAFCVFPIATILISNFHRANSTLKMLQAQTLRRTARLNSMKLEIADQKTEIAGRVSGLLMPVITDLIQRVNAAKSSDIGKQIAALRSTVDNVVRPLSQSVAREGNQLSDPQVQLDRANLLARLSPKTKLQVSQLFLPGLSSFLLTLICSSPIITFGGAQTGAIVLLVMAVSTFGILTFFKRRTVRLQLRAIPAVVIVMLSYTLITVVVTIAIALLQSNLLEISAPRLILLNVIFGIVFFVAQSRYQLLQQSSAALEEVNRELELLNAQAKQELWINRRRIATVLHGPVQAALYASAIRLTQSKRPSKKLLKEVNDDLGEALNALRFDQSEVPAVRSVIREIIDVWAGVCEIYFNVPKSVYDLTKRHANAAEAFVEIIREATSNAIKHGNANEIEVTAKQSRGVIELQIVNNGKAPTKNEANTGYGTQILNELALSWTLNTHGENKTVFTAEIVANV
ncbi:MAG: sensor histidine kinase [Micrococcales bacterium]